MTGNGHAQAAADTLRLYLTIGRTAPDVAAAVDAVATQTEAVTRALADQGVAAQDIHTSGLNIHPVFPDPQSPYESVTITGYNASHSMIVSSRDLGGFGRLLRAMVGAIGNDLGVDHVGFEVADMAPLIEQARQSAFADARERAEHLAALAGRRLGAIEAVSEQHGHGWGEPFGLSTRASGSPPDLAVAPGQQSVGVAITVNWSWTTD